MAVSRGTADSPATIAPGSLPVSGNVSRETRAIVPRRTRLASGSVSRETTPDPSLGSVLRRVVVLVSVAGLLWLPCLWGLESIGGYSVVAANHRRYLVGWSGMTASVVRQYQTLSFLDAPLCRAGWLAGLAVLSLLGRGPTRRPGRHWGWWILLAGGALLGGTLPVTTLAVLGLLVSLCLPKGRTRWGELPLWLLAAWWVSLSLATPGYTPYPRLALPWLVASWLAAGAWVGGWSSAAATEDAAGDNDASPAPRETSGVGAVPQKEATATGVRRAGATWTGTTWAQATGASLLLLILALVGTQVGGWQGSIGHSQQGLADGARQVLDGVRQSLGLSPKEPVNALVYVHAEPALVFHLRALGLPVVQPVQDLEFTRKPGVDQAPTFVIVGERSQSEPGFQGPARDDPRWRPVAQLELAVPPLVWLDEAWQPVADGGLDRPYRLEVWRVGAAPNP